MSDDKNSSGNNFGFDFSFGAGTSVQPNKIQASTPMRILVISDFSNLDQQENQSLSVARIQRVDIDNYDEILEQKAPSISVSTANGLRSDVTIKELDDFHPDQLYTNLALFEELRELRQRLDNPATFEAAAATLNAASQALKESAQTEPESEPVESKPAKESAGTDDDLIASMLATETDTPPKSAETTVSRLIESIVAPHIVPAKNPLQSSFVSSVDNSISEQIRNILHDSNFQALEARWRALHDLVVNIETDENLQLYILDIPKTSLVDEIRHADKNPEETAIGRLLAKSNDQGGWSALVTDLSFSPGNEDIMLLGTLGRIACHFNAPLLANADPALFGCESSLTEQPYSSDWDLTGITGREYWQNLRSSAIAPWIAVAAPRYLVRLPYGKTTDPAYEFEFEEIDTMSEHERFLWGPSSFGAAMLLAQSFTAKGWSMSPDDTLNIEDLPAITFTENGVKVLMPCAEVNLGESSATEMLSLGVMPLLSHSSRNLARFVRFQSIATSSTALAGPWS